MSVNKVVLARDLYYKVGGRDVTETRRELVGLRVRPGRRKIILSAYRCPRSFTKRFDCSVENASSTYCDAEDRTAIRVVLVMAGGEKSILWMSLDGDRRDVADQISEMSVNLDSQLVAKAVTGPPPFPEVQSRLF